MQTSWRIAALAVVLASGCWKAPRALVIGTSGTPGTWIEGLSPCRPEDGNVLRIDPKRPLTVFVHGINFPMGGFRTLAEIFEAHGQQTVCFHYDDRERLAASSARLIHSLEALERYLPGGDITIFGHSQGGLVSRHALVRDRERPLRVRNDVHIRLVTVSSPFAGIVASRDCGRIWLHIITLGVSTCICGGVAGSKWRDIYPGSQFMRRQGTLVSAVVEHVKIVTDERDSCRRLAPDGSCAEPDFTFALEEQYSAVVDRDRRVASFQVKSGHAAIVGEQGKPPTKLIEILQKEQILTDPPAELPRVELSQLVKQLY